jgi:hypothetical protein
MAAPVKSRLPKPPMVLMGSRMENSGVRQEVEHANMPLILVVERRQVHRRIEALTARSPQSEQRNRRSNFLNASMSASAAQLVWM